VSRRSAIERTPAMWNLVMGCSKLWPANWIASSTQGDHTNAFVRPTWAA
jgi:hypothetical protein